MYVLIIYFFSQVCITMWLHLLLGYACLVINTRYKIQDTSPRPYDPSGLTRDRPFLKRPVGWPGAGRAERRPVGRRFARPAGAVFRGRRPAKSAPPGGAGGGWRPVWSAGEAPHRSPRLGKYSTALPGAGTAYAKERHRPGPTRRPANEMK